MGSMIKRNNTLAAHSDDTLETILSENKCDFIGQYSSSQDLNDAHNLDKEYNGSSSNDIILHTSIRVGIIRRQVYKFVRFLFDGVHNLTNNGQNDDSSTFSSSISKNDAISDDISMRRKLHDFQKNSSQNIYIDSLPYDYATCSLGNPPSTFVVNPQGYWYLLWLTIVTFACAYNFCAIPLRLTFPYQTPENTYKWLLADYLIDLIYVLDIFLIKPRMMFLQDGFWIQDSKCTLQYYKKKWQFKADILSLMPLDILYFVYGTEYCYFRAPRLFKIYTFTEFFDFFDNLMTCPYAVRLIRTFVYLVYLIHLNTCAYYAVSVYEGLGTNIWVYDGQGNGYIRCFYRAIKTATSIGKNPKPSNEIEYLFMTISWLMGVFVFAILIGQIRDMIGTATKSQREYRQFKDETMDYLRKINAPLETTQRVEQWFTFTWQQHHAFDESRILDTLPRKMKEDVAIDIHMKTIKDVELFDGCDEAVLRELILKLKPVLYLPGDFICRKGTVGREMYIIKTGLVHVVHNCQLLVNLKEGSVFGEICLLNLSGAVRRTADVRSYGFSSIFVLNRSDLKEVLRYYPDCYETLQNTAKMLLKRNEVRKDGTMPLEFLCQSNYFNANDLKTLNKLGSIKEPKFPSLKARYKCRRKPRIWRRYSDSHVIYYIKQKQKIMKTAVRHLSKKREKKKRRSSEEPYEKLVHDDIVEKSVLPPSLYHHEFAL